MLCKRLLKYEKQTHLMYVFSQTLTHLYCSGCRTQHINKPDTLNTPKERL